MRYRIKNKNGRYLDAFHSNGGWEIGDVFPCSKYSWITFMTIEQAEGYLTRMNVECLAQAERWKDWTKKALDFVSSLKVEAYN